MAKFAPLRAESDEMLGLDALRFLAAMSIMTAHAVGLVYPQRFGELEQFGLFVDLFFVISGFVIAHVYSGRLGSVREYRRFLVKRLARLGPLHWLTLVAMMVAGAVLTASGVNFNADGLLDWSCAAPNFLFMQAFGTCAHPSFNAPSWSISAEMAMYAAAPAILFVSRARILAWLLVVAMFAAFTLADGQPWHAWKHQFGAVRALPSFLVGALLYRDRLLIARLPIGSKTCLGLIVAFFAGFLLGVSWIGLHLLLYAAAVAAVARDARQDISPTIRLLAPLGQLTYSIYMLHFGLLLLAVSFLGRKVLGLDETGLVLIAALSVVAVPVLSYFSLVWFERPARRAIVDLHDRGAPSKTFTAGCPAS